MMSFVDFLSDILTKPQLIEIAKKLDISHSGNKRDISERIRDKAQPKEVLNLLNISELKEICDDMGLPKKGKKDEIVERIIENIYVSKTKKYKVRKKPAKATTSVSKRKSPFYKELYEVMYKELDFNIRSKTKEKDLEDQLFQFLRAKFPSHNIQSQVRTSSKGRIDLAFEKDGIGVELKYKPKKSDLQRLVQQVEEYKEDFKKIIVLIVAENKSISVIDKYKEKIENIEGCKVIIYKI